jgi:hypothetical protein
MNMWVCRQITVLRDCFSNVSRLIRQQIPILRGLFANESPFNKLILIIGFLFLLSYPISLFVPKEQLDKILALIFFGSCIVYFLWRERIPPSSGGLQRRCMVKITASILIATTN